MAIQLTGKHAAQDLRFREDGECVVTRDSNTTRLVVKSRSLPKRLPDPSR